MPAYNANQGPYEPWSSDNSLSNFTDKYTGQGKPLPHKNISYDEFVNSVYIPLATRNWNFQAPSFENYSPSANITSGYQPGGLNIMGSELQRLQARESDPIFGPHGTLYSNTLDNAQLGEIANTQAYWGMSNWSPEQIKYYNANRQYYNPSYQQPQSEYTRYMMDTAGDMRGRAGRGDAEQAYQHILSNMPDIATDPGLGAYYDDAKRRALEGINRQAAVRGGYGSSAALGAGQEAITELEAARANREADYNLARLGELRSWESTLAGAGQQADQIEQGYLTGAGNLAQGAGNLAVSERDYLGRMLDTGMGAAGAADEAFMDKLSGVADAGGRAQTFKQGRTGTALQLAGLAAGNIQNTGTEGARGAVTAWVGSMNSDQQGQLAAYLAESGYDTQTNPLAFPKAFLDLIHGSQAAGAAGSGTAGAAGSGTAGAAGTAAASGGGI